MSNTHKIHSPAGDDVVPSIIAARGSGPIAKASRLPGLTAGLVGAEKALCWKGEAWEAGRFPPVRR